MTADPFAPASSREHPAWCSPALCRGHLADVAHVELGALFVPAAEPTSYVTLARSRVTDLDGAGHPQDAIELAVDGRVAPLSRDEALRVADQLIRLARTTGT